jgi:hypothetical protein
VNVERVIYTDTVEPPVVNPPAATKPGRVTDVRAKRIKPKTIRVNWKRVKGATSYVVKCGAKSKRALDKPAAVFGVSKRAVNCKVQGVNKAGKGSWSKTVRVKAYKRR